MTTGGNQRRQRVLAIQNHIVKVGEVNYYVSRALITDVPEMLAIERAVYAGQTPWDENAFKTELRRQSGRVFDDRRQDAHITNIAVHPDVQGQGLGHFMMQVMMKRARKLHYQTVTLEVRYSNTIAQQLYRDLGFEKTGIKKRYYFGDHEDAIDMTYRIPVATDD